VVRDKGRRVLATLVRTVGDVGLAEDAVQNAAERALQVWPRDGVPDSPRAWLTVTAAGGPSTSCATSAAAGQGGGGDGAA
jgi:predicted RNA polymerase sigma factor